MSTVTAPMTAISKSLPLPDLTKSADFEVFEKSLQTYIVAVLGPEASGLLECDQDPRHDPTGPTYVGDYLANPDLLPPAPVAMHENCDHPDPKVAKPAREDYLWKLSLFDRKEKAYKEEKLKREKFDSMRQMILIILKNASASDPDAHILLRNITTPARAMELLTNHFQGSVGGKKDGAVVAHLEKQYQAYVPPATSPPNVIIAELDVLKSKLNGTIAEVSENQFLAKCLALFHSDDRYCQTIDLLHSCSSFEPITLIRLSQALTVRFNALQLRDTEIGGAAGFLGLNRSMGRTGGGTTSGSKVAVINLQEGPCTCHLQSNYAHIKLKCHLCKQWGHTKGHCTQRKVPDKKHEKGEGDTAPSNQWYASTEPVGGVGVFKFWLFVVLLMVCFFDQVLVKRL